MRQKPLEEDDPFELKGVILPAQDGTSLREMATCFVEEFARDGWSDEQLLAMFRNPFYRGPYLVWRAKGDAYVDAVIQEVRGRWGDSGSTEKPLSSG
ncbi:MAG: hypothetical protein HYY90_05895 [Candidatus Omnitrophica bacterium]|nr:hypothetical protein [Candidatus Omnitrophota bacterium]MBI3083878.1 hypothetical protein [Candidatus Omnitrophota bacterium]